MRWWTLKLLAIMAVWSNLHASLTGHGPVLWSPLGSLSLITSQGCSLKLLASLQVLCHSPINNLMLHREAKTWLLSSPSLSGNSHICPSSLWGQLFFQAPPPSAVLLSLSLWFSPALWFSLSLPQGSLMQNKILLKTGKCISKWIDEQNELYHYNGIPFIHTNE